MMVVLRGFLVTVGLLAALWSASNFSLFLHRSFSDRVASGIMSGDRFKDDATARLVQQIEANRDRSRCDASALHALAILKLRNLEDAIAAKMSDKVSSARIAMRDATIGSLSCVPADPFLWLILAWISNQSNPHDRDTLTFLRLSYQLGPNEGWIAIRRNFIAFSMFDELPDDILDRAVVEFCRLVSSGSYEEAANILTGPGWLHREYLLQRLSMIEKFHRDSFIKVLTTRGFDITGFGSRFLDERARH